MCNKKILEIAIANRRVFKSFDYWIESELEIKIGYFVLVPFGKNSKLCHGWVLKIKDYPKDTDIKFKKIHSVIGEVIPSDLIKLAIKISKYYYSPIGKTLSCITPLLEENIEKYVMKKVICLNSSSAKQDISDDNKLTSAQNKVIKLLSNSHKFYTKSEISSLTGVSSSPIKTLLKKDIISEISIKEFKTPYSKIEIKQSNIIELTDEQKNALDKLNLCFNNEGIPDGVKSFLLYGVTGSGKTEVYLRIIDKILETNMEVIYLVPEISLTPQIIRILKNRYGDLVSVYHSRLTKKERISEWLRIKSGLSKIVIGARSAVFAPFSNLGLIIIDEEGESSYKQGDDPRYEIKQVSKFRAEFAKNCLIIMGSATPSIEVFNLAYNKQILSSKMVKRVSRRNFPENIIVDMRKELHFGNKGIFSKVLLMSMRENLKNKEQTIIFHNRRAFSTYVFCRSCGYEMRCPHCEIALKYYFSEKILKCHYCDYKIPVPEKCPECSSKYIKYFGLGTEQIEFQLKKYFPRSRVLRVDSDKVNSLKQHEKIYSLIKNKDVDIIVGTQMISRGLHIPDITLVGIIAYDSMISLPDYHSCERSFGLITQVGGRAGRGDKPGKVIVQTYNPGHYTLKAFKNNSYEEFYTREIEYRDKLFYPPKCLVANIHFVSSFEDKLSIFLESLGNRFKSEINDNEILILGPIPSPIAKIKGFFRWQILIKAFTKEKREKAVDLIQKLSQKTKYYSSIKIIIDIDPMSVL